MNETNIDNCATAANRVPCLLTTINHIIDSASALATHIDTKFTEQKFVGIVWATNGARRIPDVKSAHLDDERTYEIRFWQVIGSDNADLTLAHEFRWVNGVGAVELMLTEVTPKASSEGSESGKPCVSGWAHKVSYLQHESTTNNNADSASEPTTGQEEQDQAHTATKPMTAVEFIREEDKFGNTVVVDQLFTGEWGL